MLKQRTLNILWVILPLLMIMTVSCDREKEREYHAMLSNSAELHPQALVYWNDSEVGRVIDITSTSTDTLVGFTLKPNSATSLRHGASVGVIKSPMSNYESALKIYGGNNQQLPLLPEGATLPEVTIQKNISEFLMGNHARLATIALGTLLLILLIFWLMKKVVYACLSLALIAACGWGIYTQWQKYSSPDHPAIFEFQLDTISPQSLDSEFGENCWANMKNELKDIYVEAKEQGGQPLQEAKQKARQLLQDQVEKLKNKGYEADADELLKLREPILNMLNDLNEIHSDVVSMSAGSRTNQP